MEISLQVVLTSLLCTPGSLSNLPGRIPGCLVLLLFPYTGDRRGVDISEVFSATSTTSLAVTTDHSVRPATILPGLGVPLAEKFHPLGPRHSNY